MLKLIEIWPFKDMPLHVKHIALVHFNWPVHKMMQNDVRSVFSCFGSFYSGQIPFCKDAKYHFFDKNHLKALSHPTAHISNKPAPNSLAILFTTWICPGKLVPRLKGFSNINPLRANYCHTWHMENHPFFMKANPSCTTDSSMYGP